MSRNGNLHCYAHSYVARFYEAHLMDGKNVAIIGRRRRGELLGTIYWRRHYTIAEAQHLADWLNDRAAGYAGSVRL
jgi:hypothetical protein